MNKATLYYIESLFKKHNKGGYIFKSSDPVDSEFCLHYLRYEIEVLNHRKEDIKKKDPSLYVLSEDFHFGLSEINDDIDKIEKKIKSVNEWLKENRIDIPEQISNVEWEVIKSSFEKKVKRRLENKHSDVIQKFGENDLTVMDSTKKNKDIKIEFLKLINSLSWLQRQIVKYLKKYEPIKHNELMIKVKPGKGYRHLSEVFKNSKNGKKFYTEEIQKESGQWSLVNENLIPEDFRFN